LKDKLLFAFINHILEYALRHANLFSSIEIVLGEINVMTLLTHKSSEFSIKKKIYGKKNSLSNQ
jgi:hypothetical protein